MCLRNYHFAVRQKRQTKRHRKSIRNTSSLEAGIPCWASRPLKRVISLPCLRWQGKFVFLAPVDMVKECVWWTLLKWHGRSIFLFGQFLVNLSKYTLRRRFSLVRELCSNECFEKKRMKVARMFHLNYGVTLNGILFKGKRITTFVNNLFCNQILEVNCGPFF